jgi:hypothetical protein
MDGCSWLCNIPNYPLKKSMQTVMNIVNEGAGGRTAPLSNRDDQVIYLPANTDDYSGAYLTSPGRRNIPATTPPWTGMSEKKFLDDLIGDLNRNMLAGRDVEPNLSRSAVRPAMYTAIRTGSIESAIFVGGSNAKELAHQASALGLDAYQITKSGWKITKDNVDKLLPDLRDVLGSVPPNTPEVFFCLDNSAFMGLKDDGSMIQISKCVEGDDGYHVQGALIVAPDKALKFTMEQLRRMIDVCGDHSVFIVSPWPRYVRCPCCSEADHCTNFSEEDFLKTILADLSRLRYQLRKITQPAVVVDGLELICGGGYSGEKAVQTILSGWSSNPVHPGLHIYAKMALNLMERLAQTRMTEAAQQGRKRTWSTASSGNSSGSGGSSGRQTPCSASWKDMRDFGRFSSGGGHTGGGHRGGSGGGGYQHDPSYNNSNYSGYSGGSGHTTSYYPDHGKYGYLGRP